jgi:hypothetical protein
LSSTKDIHDAVRGGSILAAALALPGVVHAEAAPTEGLVAFKFLYYKESREWLGPPRSGYDPNADPLIIKVPSVYTLLPVSEKWSVEGSVAIDVLSGATPWYHSSAAGASRMEDRRTAGDVRVTRYFRRATWSVGSAYSSEDDYRALAFSTDLRLSTDDNNTTVAVGVGHSSDTIKYNPEPRFTPKSDQDKSTTDFLAGITRVLTPSDIVQANLTHSRSEGYLTDPYKYFDKRPDTRNATAFLVRWNRHFAGVSGTMRTSYRYYTDSWDVKGHTIGLEWAQPVGGRYVVTPNVRYVTQSAARFYADALPNGGAPAPVSLDPPYFSADSRLSAFGGVTFGLKGQMNWDKWIFDAKYDYYVQRASLRIGGEGSTNLGAFRASFFQVGVARRF